MNFYIENTKDYSEKSWIGIGRAYDDAGDLDVIYIDLIIWRFSVYFN